MFLRTATSQWNVRINEHRFGFSLRKTFYERKANLRCFWLTLSWRSGVDWHSLGKSGLKAIHIFILKRSLNNLIVAGKATSCQWSIVCSFIFFVLLLTKESHVLLNPLHPESEWHLISPNNIPPESHIKVMRIKKMITNQRSFWSVNEFSLSVTLGKCIKKDNMHTDVRV